MANRFGQEFSEIAHCGGRVTIRIQTDAEGGRGAQISMSHSSPNPAAWFAIYAVYPGVPIGMIQLGGIGDHWNPPPLHDAFSVFIASDSQGLFGHECPRCKGYWRSNGTPSGWRATCPYCALRTESHQFLTKGQRKYVQHYSGFYMEALNSDQDGEHVIDWDAVADIAAAGEEKPPFYYSEESQQTRFRCKACTADNDILGRYGYCSSCGTHNGRDDLIAVLDRFNGELEGGKDPAACVKDAVSTFDSCLRQLAGQLAARIPMTDRRRAEWKGKLFHNLVNADEALRTVFDIRILRRLNPKEVSFASMMFQRRHVYEHNGGQADDRYLKESGDKDVRVGQLIRETHENIVELIRLIRIMAEDVHTDFHEILKPEPIPINIEVERQKMMRASRS